MFDKITYWERRKEGKRGQGDGTNVLFIPKGETVSLPNKKVRGHLITNRTLPNAKGKTFVQEPTGKGGMSFVAINRKQSRQRTIDRDYTKPNYSYRTHRDESPFAGHVRNVNRRPILELPTRPAGLTNHERILERRQA